MPHKLDRAQNLSKDPEWPPLRVMVVDDHPLVLTGIKTALSRVSGLVVCASADNGDDALQGIIAHKPDLMILDVNLPGLRSDLLVLEARKHHPTLRTLILSAFDDEVYLRRFSQVPISGYMLKDEAPEGLSQAVRVIQQGAMWFSQSVAHRIMAIHHVDRTLSVSLFSDREKEILTLLAQGHNNQALGARLNLARQTVSNLLSTIYQKMGVHNRIQAMVWIRDNESQAGLSGISPEF